MFGGKQFADLYDKPICEGNVKFEKAFYDAAIKDRLKNIYEATGVAITTTTDKIKNTDLLVEDVKMAASFPQLLAGSKFIRTAVFDFQCNTEQKEVHWCKNCELISQGQYCNHTTMEVQWKPFNNTQPPNVGHDSEIPPFGFHKVNFDCNASGDLYPAFVVRDGYYEVVAAKARVVKPKIGYSSYIGEYMALIDALEHCRKKHMKLWLEGDCKYNIQNLQKYKWITSEHLRATDELYSKKYSELMGAFTPPLVIASVPRDINKAADLLSRYMQCIADVDGNDEFEVTFSSIEAANPESEEGYPFNIDRMGIKNERLTMYNSWKDDAQGKTTWIGWNEVNR
ncbi:hypothetical protein QJS04_geneDACA021884 [Acorus gramineus]|uniref:RNase H type-1 domain-containing protein n=1 Tax=Acorus gramineus TaxID=55184 RepID=A0AAV9AJ91_ACOGR|nr:hypothetical protein QJS04_geneDACA021884 [Acorus gramineus]